MKKTFAVTLDTAVIDELVRVSGGAHMHHAAYAAVILSRFADLKTEFALDALTAIPKEFFRGRPGRPAAASRGSVQNEPALAENPR